MFAARVPVAATDPLADKTLPRCTLNWHAVGTDSINGYESTAPAP